MYFLNKNIFFHSITDKKKLGKEIPFLFIFLYRLLYTDKKISAKNCASCPVLYQKIIFLYV